MGLIGILARSHDSYCVKAASAQLQFFRTGRMRKSPVCLGHSQTLAKQNDACWNPQTLNPKA